MLTTTSFRKEVCRLSLGADSNAEQGLPIQTGATTMTTFSQKLLTSLACVVMFLVSGISGCQENQPPQQTQQQEENEKIPVSVFWKG